MTDANLSIVSLMQVVMGDRKYKVTGLEGEDLSNYDLLRLEIYVAEQSIRREKGYLTVKQRKTLDKLKKLIERLKEKPEEKENDDKLV